MVGDESTINRELLYTYYVIGTYITLEIFKGDQKKSGAEPKRLQLSKDQITSSQGVILIYKLFSMRLK